MNKDNRNNKINIVDYDYPSLINLILEDDSYKKIFLTYFNFSTYLLADKSHLDFFRLTKDFIFHIDGLGIYLFSKLIFGNRFKHSINGSNLYPVLVDNLLESGKKFFVIFSSKYHESYIAKSMQEYFGDYYQFIGFCVYSELTSKKLIRQINSFEADVVFIGIGQPYQEMWVLKNKEFINSRIFICSGSGFEFILGLKKRAPLWIQKIGCEWLFRLFQEPKRLWKRYIFGIPVFIFHILIQKVKLMLKKV